MSRVRVRQSLAQTISFWSQRGPKRPGTTFLPGQDRPAIPPLDPRPAPRAAVAERRAEAGRLPRTSAQLKTNIISRLETRRPREALHLFSSFLENPSPASTPRTVQGLAWLFFSYRQPDAGLDAILRMHAKGFRIPANLATRALHAAYDTLVLAPDKMDIVFGWLKLGISGGTDRTVLEQGLVETVLETLWRAGRTDWLAELFEAYLASLPEGEVSSARAWTIVLNALGSSDADAATILFQRWRSAWFDVYPRGSPDAPTPPEGPYLALLWHLAIQSRHSSRRTSKAYAFLYTFSRDGLPLSTKVVNGLLHLELTRGAYPSFWAIWDKMPTQATASVPSSSSASAPPPNPFPARDAETWRLALRARTLQASLPRSRSRPTLPFPSSPSSPSASSQLHPSPRHRLLFHHFLSTSLAAKSSRPSLVLPSSSLSHALVTPSVLNDFLKLFVRVRDWPAAAVVLESFAVARVEPNSATHANVVLGVVSAWEKGKVERGRLEEEGGLEWRSGGKKRRGGVSLLDRRLDGLELVRRIMGQRKMRIALWTRRREEEGEGEEGTNAARVPPTEERLPRQIDMDMDIELVEDDHPPSASTPRLPPPPPAWMIRRELRDTAYLTSLLRRCEGLSDPDWALTMVEARKEILPSTQARRDFSSSQRFKAWKQRVSLEESRKRRSTTGERYRDGMRTAAVKEGPEK